MIKLIIFFDAKKSCNNYVTYLDKKNYYFIISNIFFYAFLCFQHNRNDFKSSSQKKKKIVKVANSKSVRARNTGSHKEEKTSRFDEKQMHGLRKRIVELRLQQEREDLQKYLQELKNSRLESGCTRSYFSPLEFPKIAEFTQSGKYIYK